MAAKASGFGNPHVIYQYPYGAGRGPDRQVEFIKDGSTWKVLVRDLTQPTRMQQIALDDISVELASTTGKMLAMQAARRGQKVKLPQEMKLSDADQTLQNRIIEDINHERGRRIEIENNGTLSSGMERVVSLKIFDPR